VQLALYNDKPTSSSVATRFAEDRVLSKLQAIDSRARRKGVAALDPSRNELIRLGMELDAKGKVVKNSFGVFHLSWLAQSHPEWPAQIREELAQVKQAIRATHKQPLRFLIWAGMGGSAEDKSLYLAAGLLKRGPKLYVLDSTDPAKLASILEDIQKRAGSIKKALRSTLVVGMAMGMTSYEPVVNLEKLAKLYDREGIDSRPNFLYLTLPGSLLDKFAGPRGYRKVELQLDNGNSTAGRHSSPLTRGSLYPLGLAGVDLDQWISGTFLSESEIHTAWSLAAFLHLQGLEGRDKVTFLPSPSLAATGVWTKQNFEESLGKSEDLGIKIVLGEKPTLAHYRAAKDPKQDRVFWIVERKGEKWPGREKLPLLRREGYSIAVLTIDKTVPLSRYMQFIHYVVFGIASLRKMNFVTQPSVELYKSITNPIHQNAVFQGGIENTREWKEWVSAPEQAKWRGVTLRWNHLPCEVVLGDRDAPSAYAALIKQFTDAGIVEYGELTYFGDTRYSRPGRALRKVLDRAAESVLRTRLRMPADVYEGPAMNHSYHEMIIGHGRAFSTVLLTEKPAKGATGETADYHRAQFLATQLALRQKGRLVVSLTLKDLSETSLRGLSDFFSQVAVRLKRLA
jgi:hypothetical protein